MNIEGLKAAIRDVPDFPKNGIIFKDITTLLNKRDKFKGAIEVFKARYLNKKIDVIVCVEARGFIFGGALAYALGAAFVPVRKKGKLPYKKYRATYSLEYGKDTVEIHRDAFTKGARVLVLDDLLATGGTISAACKLVERLGGRIVEVAFLIELEFLKGRSRLAGYPVFSVIKY